MILDDRSISNFEWCFENYSALEQYIVENGGDSYRRHTVGEEAGTDRHFRIARILASIVEEVCGYYSDGRKIKLIQKRYFDKLSTHQVMRKMRISETTYYAWRQEILTYAAFRAQKRGVWDIDDMRVLSRYIGALRRAHIKRLY